ncbi:hypothetical protein BDC45DRAFT_541469 [Circinella umbellata]|nr:hypothetical protein BDC45DRAFT_541469 [Circinella umbellata]
MTGQTQSKPSTNGGSVTSEAGGMLLLGSMPNQSQQPQSQVEISSAGASMRMPESGSDHINGSLSSSVGRIAAGKVLGNHGGCHGVDYSDGCYSPPSVLPHSGGFVSIFNLTSDEFGINPIEPTVALAHFFIEQKLFLISMERCDDSMMLSKQLRENFNININCFLFQLSKKGFRNNRFRLLSACRRPHTSFNVFTQQSAFNSPVYTFEKKLLLR